MSQALKRALFSAVLLLLLAVPVFGLRLQTEDVSLVVQQADASVWWTIGGATVVLFVWQLVRDRVPLPAFLRAGHGLLGQARLPKGACATGSRAPRCSVASCTD